MRDGVNTACVITLNPSLTIVEPAVLTLTSTGNIVLNCFGDTNGTGTFYASGGNTPYTFTFITNTTGATEPPQGFNSQSFFLAGAGTITVKVVDAKMCETQATITVTQPAILTPGAVGTNQVICYGSNPAMLTQTTAPTGGPGAYNYQWQFSNISGGTFTNIPGATLSTYTPPTGATTTMYYRRMVTSGVCPAVYSNEVEVLVNPLPVAMLTGGATICPTETAVLNVNMVVGTGPFELDIENYPGLTITGYVNNADIFVTPAATTTYKLLRVRDANGCEIISPSASLIGSATVVVRALPAITTSPANKIVCEYSIVNFNVVATGSDLTYQWYVDQGSGPVALSDAGVYFGVTSPTLNIFGATRDMNGYIYSVEVTGCATTVTSANALLTVNTSPEILTQPVDSTICSASDADFTVTAQGTTLTYQWEVKIGAAPFVNVSGANYAGETSNVLSVINAPAGFNNNIYRVKITGTCGIPVYSNFVVLRVLAPPTVAVSPSNKEVCDTKGPIIFNGSGVGLIDSLRWQVSTNGGGTWNPIYDNANYSGTTSQQLTLSDVPLAFNTYQYRLGIIGKCVTIYTGSATLTVNANPTGNIWPADTLMACGDITYPMNGNPAGGTGTYSNHRWSGDVAPLSNYYVVNPNFRSPVAGNFKLYYQVTDTKGCVGTDSVVVKVEKPTCYVLHRCTVGLSATDGELRQQCIDGLYEYTVEVRRRNNIYRQQPDTCLH